MNAIGNADSAVAVACQCKPRILFERRVYPRQFFGMTEIVLLYGFAPPKDARENGGVYYA